MLRHESETASPSLPLLSTSEELYYSMGSLFFVAEMDLLPDLVWWILLEKGADIQMKYSTWQTDAMPKPKRKFLQEDLAYHSFFPKKKRGFVGR